MQVNNWVDVSIYIFLHLFQLLKKFYIYFEATFKWIPEIDKTPLAHVG